MKAIFFVCSSALLLFVNDCLGQNYAYSFSGKADTTLLIAISEEISTTPGVKEVKWRYKVEKEAGEFIIYSLNYSDKKNPYPFDPKQVKSILLNHELSPLRLLELPN